EEMDNRRAALSDALEVLNDRERRIFEARRLADEPVTLEDLAVEFGVSRERVRQIEGRAFEKVQKAVKNRVAAMETPAARGGAGALRGAHGRIPLAVVTRGHDPRVPLPPAKLRTAQLLPSSIVDRVLVGCPRGDEAPSKRPLVIIAEPLAGVGRRRSVQQSR